MKLPPVYKARDEEGNLKRSSKVLRVGMAIAGVAVVATMSFPTIWSHIHPQVDNAYIQQRIEQRVDLDYLLDDSPSSRAEVKARAGDQNLAHVG